MPEVYPTEPTYEQRQLDRQLLLGLMLPIAAAGLHTIVGFTVAHWIVITASKRTGYVVSVTGLMLCGLAALLASGAYRQLGEVDDAAPEQGRRLFMAKLGLLLSAFAAIAVIAGTLVLVTLGPSD